MPTLAERMPGALAAAGLLVVAAPAAALGIGQPQTVPTWGRPLDVRLPVSGVEAGEAQDACFQVDVFDGDVSLPQPQVSWTLEAGASPGDRWLRVRTSRPLREPVVTLNVEARCTGRLLRTVTLLPEPTAADLAPATQLAAAPAEPTTSALPLTALDPPAAGSAASRAARPTVGVRARAPAAARTTRTVPARPKAAEARVAQPRLQLSAPTLLMGLAAGSAGQASLQPFPPAVGPSAAVPAVPSAPVVGAVDETVRRELARLAEVVRAQQATIARLEARPPVRSFPLDAWVATGGVAAALAAVYCFLRLRRVQRERAPWFDSSVLTYLDESERTRFA